MSIFVPQFQDPQDTMLKAIAIGQQYAAGMRALENNRLLDLARRQLQVDPQTGLMTLATLDPSMSNAALNVHSNPFEQQIRAQQEMRLAEGMQNQVRQEQRLAQNQEFLQGLPLSDTGKQLIDEGWVAGTPEFIAEYRRRTKLEEDLAAKRAANSGTRVNINNIPQGNIPLGTSAKNEAMDRFLTSSDILSSLNSIKSIKNYKRLLGYIGRGKTTALELADNLGIPVWGSGEQQLEDASDLKMHVGNVLNTYRRMITGAAAPVAELKLLEQQLLNTSLPPKVFQQRVDTLISSTLRATRINMKLLREGLNPNSQEYGAALNKAWVQREQANTKADKAFAFQEAFNLAYSEMVAQGVPTGEARTRAAAAAAKSVQSLGF